MFAEAVKEYRGVLCRRCCEPIPISAKVASLRDEVEASDASAPHSFIARCRICHHESIYALSHIRVFEGEPRPRRLKARAAGV